MTKKHLSVAGSHVEAFAQYMLKAGHDIWHYLDDRTLRSICYLICGMCPGRSNDPDTGNYRNADNETDLDLFGQFITDKQGVMYRPGGPVTLYNFEHVGERHEKVAVTAIIDVGQAAADRYPFGTLGVSSIITGSDMVITMLNNISSKVNLDGVQEATSGFAAIGGIAKDSHVSRDTILVLRRHVGKPIRIAYGYCDAIPELKALANSYESLCNFSRQNPAEVAIGSTLAARVRELSADPDAVAGAIQSAFAAVAAAIAGVEEADEIDTTEMTLDAVVVPEVQIYRNTTQIQDETQRRQNAANLALLG
jgi:hypothetical protein